MFRPSETRGPTAPNLELITRIQNPLYGLSRETLYKMADDFCVEHDFTEKQDLFRRASVLAQNPNDFESLAELTDDDKHWIRRETTREYPTQAFMLRELMRDKWSHPWQLYYLIIVASLASAVQGWDNTGANGAK